MTWVYTFTRPSDYTVTFMKKTKAPREQKSVESEKADRREVRSNT